jgi:hypothetical protein
MGGDRCLRSCDEGAAIARSALRLWTLPGTALSTTPTLCPLHVTTSRCIPVTTPDAHLCHPLHIRLDGPRVVTW